MTGRLPRIPALWPLVALLALLALAAFLSPNFLSISYAHGRLSGSIIDILKNGAPVMLLAVGMTVVIASGGIDLSVGSIMALAGVAGALLVTEHGAPVPMALAAGLGAGLLVGLLNGALVTFGRVQPIVATLVTLVSIRGVAQALSDDQKVRFDSPLFESLARGTILALPTPFWLAAGAAAAVALILRVTAFGMYVEAIGVNPRAARLCGLRVPAIRLTVYAASGLCAALAGLIATADIKEADVATCGLYLELDAILAVAIGGTALTGGRPMLLGSILGALIMQTLRVALLSAGAPEEHALLIKAVAALAVCFLQTPGLVIALRSLQASPASAAGPSGQSPVAHRQSPSSPPHPLTAQSRRGDPSPPHDSTGGAA